MAKAFFESHTGERIEIGQGGTVRIAMRSNDSKAQQKRRDDEGSSLLWREEDNDTQ